MLLVIAAFLLLVTNKAHAQGCTNFNPPIVTEESTDPGNITDVVNTGNDSRDTPTDHNTLPVLEVTVWDGASPGLNWRMSQNTSYEGFISLSSRVSDPDVVLVPSYSEEQQQDTWFAVIAYIDNSNGYCYCIIYEWDMTNSTFATYAGSPATYLLSALGNITTINIDADYYGHFAIIWDDPSKYRLCITTGQGNVSTPPTLCNSGAFTEVANTAFQYYKEPDIALFNDGEGNITVHYVYLDNSGNSVYVGSDDFADLCSGLTYNNNDYSIGPLSGHEFLHPRIACPSWNGMINTDWSVAVEMQKPFPISGTAYEIISFTNYLSSVYINFYTGGTTTAGLCAIDDMPNYLPVVCYDYYSTGIMIGWTSEENNSGSYTPISIVAIVCDVTGTPASGCFDNSGGYGLMIVPTDNSSNTKTALSISGRHYVNTGDLQYSFYNENTSDIKYKDVAFCNVNYALRTENNKADVEVFPNPFSEDLKINLTNPETIALINITDVSGKLLLSASGNEAILNVKLNAIAGKLASGIYLIKMQSDDKIINQKIIKM